jgi:anti-sigma B factor antagonist
MKISSERIDENKVRITIQGEFDARSCQSFKDEVLQLLSDNIKEINVNLAEMDFIDSPGIGTFISTANAIKKIDGNFRLEEPQMHISDLFEATQVTKYLNILGK